MKHTQNITKDKLWTKHFVIILIISFFASVIMNMQGSTLPMYVQHIGGSKSSVGIVTGIFTLSALLFRPWFGNLLDNSSRRIVLIIGIIILSLVSLSYNLAYTVGILLFLRFLHGIGLSAQTTAVGTIISDIVPHTRLGEGVGYNGIAVTAATAIGPALGLYLIQYYNYNTFFGVTFVFGVLALIGALFINYERKKINNLYVCGRNIGGKNKKYSGVIKDKAINSSEDYLKKRKKGSILEATAVPASIVMFFIMLTTASIFTFLPVYATSRNISNIGIFFTIYALAFLVTRTITDKLSARYSITRIMLPGMILLILSFVILAFATTLPGFLIAGVLYGAGYSSTQPTLSSLAVSQCSPDRRGAANATFFSSMDIGFCIGAVIWGVLSQKIGLSSIYLGSAVCGILSLSIYVFMLNNKLMKNNSDSNYQAVENL
ncbi:MFS transporter [Clostridium polyendosporum]|uniref:MFS transporter n=1 Tax=Clostridium polyendosporum TaxID=69208 RepID=A0A919VN51_9CLOT|nr:MFS transporter [Clostridium polyendosporum]GIM30228.1 MFS transporter [Clostridium polyendosporum]